MSFTLGRTTLNAGDELQHVRNGSRTDVGQHAEKVTKSQVQCYIPCGQKAGHRSPQSIKRPQQMQAGGHLRTQRPQHTQRSGQDN